MSWMAGIGAGLSSLGGSMQAREAEKRAREDRLKDIRDKLSLVNAQAPEKRRVIPGQELPADVAGPPAPEMVETYKTSLEYDPEKGYVAKDQVTGSTRNQWSTTDKSAKEAGGKVYKKTTETDLAGNQRTQFDEEDAAQKLKKERILRGDDMVDVMMNESGEIVNELGRGGRYKPVGAGRSPEEREAYLQRQDELARGRLQAAEDLRNERYIANSAAGQIDEWRGMRDSAKQAYNESLGLSPKASEQEVRNAIRKRIMDDRSAPAMDDPKAGKPKVDDRDGTVEPFKKPKEEKVDKPAEIPVAKVDENPKDQPKEDKKKDGGVKFDDPVMQKNFEEDEAEFQRILRMTQGKEARDKLIADYQRQMMELYDVRFK